MTAKETHKDLVKLVLDSARNMHVEDGGIELDAQNDQGMMIKINARVHHGSVPLMETRFLSKDSWKINSIAEDVLNTFGGKDYFDASFIGLDEKKERKYRIDAHSMNWFGKLFGWSQKNSYGLYDSQKKLTPKEFNEILTLLVPLNMQYELGKINEAKQNILISEHQSVAITHRQMAEGFRYAIANGIDARIVSNNHKNGVTLKHKPARDITEVSIIQAGDRTLLHPVGRSCLTENRIYPVERFIDLRLAKMEGFNLVAKPMEYKDPVKDSISNYPRHTSNVIEQP